MQSPARDENTVFDFGLDTEPWPNIDDVVMGGRSHSSMSLKDGIAHFEGVVSLENNGGFASLRSRPAQHDLAGFDGLLLRVRGDGKKYGVRLRTTSDFDGVSYEADLPTQAGHWVEVELPFENFSPSYRGRPVEGHPALDPGKIQTFGLMLSDGQEGPFQLAIDWIKAFRHDAH